jgi:hypothetical protein
VESICDSIIRIVLKDQIVNGTALFEFKHTLKDLLYDKVDALEINKFIVETVPKLIIPRQIVVVPPPPSLAVLVSNFIIDHFFSLLLLGFAIGYTCRFLGLAYRGFARKYNDRRSGTFVEEVFDEFLG